MVVILRDELPFFVFMTSGELISKVEGFLPPLLELSFCYALIVELLVYDEMIVLLGSGRIYANYYIVELNILCLLL